jgi:hypothetical protein
VERIVSATNTGRGRGPYLHDEGIQVFHVLQTLVRDAQLGSTDRSVGLGRGQELMLLEDLKDLLSELLLDLRVDAEAI